MPHWAEELIADLLEGVSDADQRTSLESDLRRKIHLKMERAAFSEAAFNAGFERALELGIDDPSAYAEKAVGLAYAERRQENSTSKLRKLIARQGIGAADHGAVADERASRTANPMQRRKAQADRQYLEILGKADFSGQSLASGSVRAKIEKSLGSYRLPHWEKTTLALKVMALSVETAKRSGRTINLHVSSRMMDKALASGRGPVSFVQNQVRETLKRKLAADAPEFWFVLERDNDRRFHLHGAYESASHVDHHHVDAALRAASGWDAPAGIGLAQLSNPLWAPYGWAHYVVKTMNLTATMTDRKLLGSTSEIKASARGNWDTLRASLPSV